MNSPKTQIFNRLKLLTFLAVLGGCASNSPYYEMAAQVKNDVSYTRQGGLGNAPDHKVYGCRESGDCDDRALCAACRLVKSGANPQDIIVVVQGWNGFDSRASSNHMALEYNGSCILGYASTAYAGSCEHPWEDKKMRTVKIPLPEYLRKVGAEMQCK